MRKLLISLLVFTTLLGCSALSKINEIPNGKSLESEVFDRKGGILEVKRDNKSLDGVSIKVLEDSVPIETEFEIRYIESFPKKPKIMKAESIAFEFEFDDILSRRAIITIPYVTEDVTLSPIALFNYDKNDRIWHFAGSVKLNKSEKKISAMILSPGIYAAMSYYDELPRSGLTDFEVGFDTLNADLAFTKEFSNASASYAFWYFNNKRELDVNLYDKYDIYNDSKITERISLLVAQAANFEFYKSQFTTVPDVMSELDLSNKVITDTIKTALTYENRPIVAVMSVQDIPQLVIINKFDNNDFSCYAPYISKNELIISYDGINLELKDPRNVIAQIDKIGFIGSMSGCNEGFESIYKHFENTTTFIKSERIGGNTGGTITINSGFLKGYEFEIPANAITDDLPIVIDKIDVLPELPSDATLVKSLFRLTGPIDSMFDNPVKITIPDMDLDNDGFIDGTTIPWKNVRVGAYNFNSNCWANAKVSYELFSDDMIIESYYASDYAMFYFDPNTQLPEPEIKAVTIFDSWPTGALVSEVVSNLNSNKINTLNIVAYECDGYIPAIERINSYYNFNNLIVETSNNDIDVNLIISCFKYYPIDDVDEVDKHSAYIAKKLIPDIIDNYPGIKGIILQDTQYNRSGPTNREMELLSRFIQRVREQIGKKSKDNIKLILEVDGTSSCDCSNEFGQRITDFAKYADELIIRLYDNQYQPYNSDDTSKFIENIKLSCSSNNNVKISSKISTRVNSTNNVTLSNQLITSLKLNVDGFVIEDYQRTDVSEWNTIAQFIP